MMQELYVTIYGLPMVATVALMIGFAFVWRYLCTWCRKIDRRRKAAVKLVLALGFFLWLAVVLHMTVFSRSSGMVEVQREPFYQIREYLNGGPKELIRTLWMNVLLFVPGGVLLEALLPRHWSCWIRMILSVLVLFALSVGIETAQYWYALGCVEADDVLCNTLGAVLGVTIHEIGQHSWRRTVHDR